MARVFKVKKPVVQLYGGVFGEDFAALLGSFKVSENTATKLYNGGFASVYDLANLVDDYGFGVQNETASQFYACAENAAQWNVLRIMLMKFGYLLRPEAAFDFEKDGEIFVKDLSSVVVIEGAWMKRYGQSAETEPIVSISGAAKNQKESAGKNQKESAEKNRKESATAGKKSKEKEVRGEEQGEGDHDVQEDSENTVDMREGSKELESGKGVKRKWNGEKKEDSVTSNSSGAESTDDDKEAKNITKLPKALQKARNELIEKCLLSGDIQYPQSVVSEFGNYVKSFKKYADITNSAKPARELGLLEMVLGRVQLRCRSGDKGCAMAIYQFLTDEAGSKRAQTAFRCMKEGNSFQMEMPAPRMMAPNQFQRGSGLQRGRGGNRGRGGIRCFGCHKFGHYQRQCPINRF